MSQTINSPILEVRNITKEFARVKAVNNISFDVNRGEVFAFLGPNGAGKTTTLRMLLDIINADSGLIHWNINGRTTCPLPSQIGYLPEERGLYPDISVLRSLVYLASIRGMDKALAKKEAMGWLERLALADRANDKLQALSKGNQQKVQFIASILHKPAFAILDEPFSGFDPVNQEMFIDFIKEINAAGTTVLLSAHQMQLVERIAHRILLINNGEELFMGSLDAVYSTHGGKQVIEVETETDEDALPVMDGIDQVETMVRGHYRLSLGKHADLRQVLYQLASIPKIKNISTQKPNLHDIFLHLVKNHAS